MDQQRPSLQTIFDQMGKSVPLEIGFDRSLAGSREGVTLTTPIPKLNIMNEPISPLTATPYFGDVLTRSSIPTFSGMGAVPPQYAIVQQATPLKQIPMAPPESPPEEEKCSGPGGLCPEASRKALFDLLTADPVDISCACNTWEYYPLSNPSDGDFTWKAGLEFIYRSDQQVYVSADTYTLKYSRWTTKQSPGDSSTPSGPKILLLHDALDSRKSWWCCQKLLSPFADTISVDLLGSGESLKPRGLNVSTGNTGGADPFPWSYALHAQYLIGMANVIWPVDNYFVVGVGWGAQIAATMAAMSPKVAGVIMINPPGFGKNTHPELYYSDITSLGNVTFDPDFDRIPVSYIGRIRDCLISSLSSSDSHHSGRDTATTSTIRLVLEQYSDLDRKRVLVDQIMSFANLGYQELPKTPDNDDGLEIDKITAPVLVVSGGNDIIYPPEHRHLYPAVYYNSTVQTSYMPNVGHLLHIEAPRALAETIIGFIRQQVGFSSLNDAFIGFSGSSQGNERAIVEGLRSLYDF